MSPKLRPAWPACPLWPRCPPALRASAAGPEGASLTLRFSPQCSLPNLYRKMIRAFRDMRLVA